MNIFEAVILGLIQGLTEFLPVSSSGHLEIAKAFFGINPEGSFYFTVAVHGATVLSTIAVFYRELFGLAKGVMQLRINQETSYTIKILISMIPVALVGFLLKDEVEALFNGNIVMVGCMLIVTALLLLAGHFTRKREREIGFLDSLIIGIAQAFAVIPGISRSGATISAGLILGNRKDEIARFSFLMVLIPVIGANLVELMTSEVMIQGSDTAAIVAGFITAFISGYLACRWMITLVRKSRMIWFAAYCILAGLIAIIAG